MGQSGTEPVQTRPLPPPLQQLTFWGPFSLFLGSSGDFPPHSPWGPCAQACRQGKTSLGAGPGRHGGCGGLPGGAAMLAPQPRRHPSPTRYPLPAQWGCLAGLPPPLCCEWNRGRGLLRAGLGRPTVSRGLGAWLAGMGWDWGQMAAVGLGGRLV